MDSASYAMGIYMGKQSAMQLSSQDFNLDLFVKAFVDAYKAEYDALPDQFAADGYDAIMILFEAMKKANVNDVTISASDLTDLIKPILTGGEFKYSGVTGKNMTWTAEGSCEKEANIVTLDR